MAENGNWLVEVKPWYVVGNTDDNPDITKYMGYYQLKIGYHLGDAVLSAAPRCVIICYSPRLAVVMRLWRRACVALAWRSCSRMQVSTVG